MSHTRRKSAKTSVRASSRKPKIKRVRAAAPSKFTSVIADATQENLRKIDHIVVLVLENRSFDHMLGYLKLEAGRNVDGLAISMSNTYKNKSYSIHHLKKTAFQKNQDPCHDGECVTEQLSNNNWGFVSNYAKTHVGDPEVDLVMGYYNGSDLPVYDHLSRNFAICERWFCSVDGATWPNRLYAVTGRAAGSKVNKKVPVYSLPSFIRHLENKKVSWRWYAHDFATLRVTDEKFRVGSFKHFSYFDRHSLPPGASSFLEDAASGKLASVSWIDPNFVDLSVIGPSGSNDDHPPSDVMAGQELVLKVYNAVSNGPRWAKTLLVIVYIPDMGTRVNRAAHLGGLLTLDSPRPPIALQAVEHLISRVATWKTELFSERLKQQARGFAPGPPKLNELQQGVLKAKAQLRTEGLPPGQP